MGGTASGSFGQVRLDGTLTLVGSNLSVSVVNGFTLAVGQTFVILDNTSSTTGTGGTFANAPGGLYTDAAGDRFLVNYAASADGDLVFNDVTLTAVSVVPEPSTWTLLSIGVACLLGLALRRHSTCE